MTASPLATPLLIRHAVRRLRMHGPGNALLVLIVALATAVGVAVLYAAEASLASFGRSIDVLGNETVELRHHRGYLTSTELGSFYRYLQKDFETTLFLETRGQALLDSSNEIPVTLVGGDPIETARTLGSNPSSDGVLLSAGLCRSLACDGRSQIRVRAQGREHTFGVAPTRLASEDAVIGMRLSELQRLLDRQSQVTGIRIKARPSDQPTLLRLRASIGHAPPFHSLYLSGSTDRRERARSLLAAFRMNIGVMVLMTALVCALALYNASSLSLLELEQELAMMRTIGFRPASLFFLVFLESALVGILGAIAGVTLGRPLALAAAALFLDSVSAVYLPGEEYSTLASSLPLWTVFMALIGGVVVAALGSLVPALTAARLLKPIARPSWPLLFFALAGTALSLLLADFFQAPLLAQTAAIGVVLAIGVAALPAIRQVTRTLRLPAQTLAGAPGMIAIANVSASAKRAGVTVAASGAAICLLIGLGTMIESFRNTLTEWVAFTVRADLFVRSQATGQRDAPAWMQDDAVQSLLQHPAISSAIRYAGIEIPFHSDWVVLGGVDFPTSPGQREYRFLSGGMDLLALQEGSAVLASETAARRFSLKVGDSLPLEGHTFRLAGVYRDYSETRGTLLLSLPVFQNVTDLRHLVSIAAHVRSGVDVSALQRELQQHPAFNSTLIQQNRELRSSISKIFDDTFRVTALMRIILLLICAAGFVVTLLQLVWERRRELRTLELLGTSRFQLRSALIGEGALLALASSLIGIPGGIALALILILYVNPLSFGWTLSVTIPLSSVLTPPLLVFAAGVLAALFAGALHLNVITQTRTNDE